MNWPCVRYLALRYQAGDPFAGSDAIRELEPVLRSLARRFGARHTSDVEDWLQEARIAAMDALRRYRPDRSDIAAWIRGCVYKRLTTYLAWHCRQGRRAQTLSLDYVYEHDDGGDRLYTLAEQVEDPAGDVERRVLARWAWQAIVQRLSSRDRLALFAWLSDGAGGRGSQRAVAERLGINGKAADNLMYRIRRQARQQAQRMGVA